MQAPRLLNLGCGHVSPDGWINVDGSNRAWLSSKWPLLDRTLTFLRLLPPTEFSARTKYADLTRRFPWEDGSVRGVYMGESLDNFTVEDGESVLHECYRVLEPGGIIRIRVPDYGRFWQSYVDAYTAIRQRPRTEWTQEHTRWVSMFFRSVCVRKPGPFKSFGHYHKWMYDDVSLVFLLEKIGFKDVGRMEFHKSRLPGVEAVEARDDLIVEAVK